MVKYGNIPKQICFDSSDKLHAEMKIRLHYDEIKIKEFFNEIIKAYVSKDEHIMKFVKSLKERKGISNIKKKKYKQTHEKEKQNIKQFGLNSKEVENIFDILEKESEI